MMDTVLNLGMNDESVEALASKTGNPRFAWDSYRRFVQMFGNVVSGSPGDRFESEIARVKADRGVKLDTELDIEALQELTSTFKEPRRLPERPARAARRRDPRRLRLVDGRSRRDLPAHQPHPRRLGHGRQRSADGVRQQGRDIGLGRRLQPRRSDRRAGAVGRLPDQRTGRGRRFGAFATRSTSPRCAT